MQIKMSLYWLLILVLWFTWHISVTFHAPEEWTPLLSHLHSAIFWIIIKAEWSCARKGRKRILVIHGYCLTSLTIILIDSFKHHLLHTNILSHSQNKLHLQLCQRICNVNYFIPHRNPINPMPWFPHFINKIGSDKWSGLLRSHGNIWQSQKSNRGHFSAKLPPAPQNLLLLNIDHLVGARRWCAPRFLWLSLITFTLPGLCLNIQTKRKHFCFWILAVELKMET